ncbi:MAG: amino acid kinase family protein, partial [Candidatus Ranarchaeia archaeon]
MKDLVVVKIGGSCLDSSQGVRHAAETLKNITQEKYDVVAVVSAMKGETERLLRLVDETTDGNKSNYAADVVAMGERTSARLLAAALDSMGIKSSVIDTSDVQWPIITRSDAFDSDPLYEETRVKCTRLFHDLLSRKILPIICGFVGKTVEGKVTLLGRGGSDTTAVLLGNVLDAKEVILLKDVQGVLTGDPRELSGLKTIDLLHVNEALMLTGSGSKIIYHRALKWKTEYCNIRVVGFTELDVLNGGTLIVGKTNSDLGVYPVGENVTMLTILGGLGTLKEIGSLLDVIDRIRNKVLGASFDRSSITVYINGKVGKGDFQRIHDQAVSCGAKAVSR